MGSGETPPGEQPGGRPHVPEGQEAGPCSLHISSSWAGLWLAAGPPSQPEHPQGGSEMSPLPAILSLCHEKRPRWP